MVKRTVLIALIVFGVFASNASLCKAEGTSKIGFVDVMYIADNYEKTKDIRQQIEDERESREADIKNKLKELRKLRDELELTGLEGKEGKREEFSKMVKELDNYQRQANLELKKEKDKKAMEILKEVEDTVSDYGKQEGFDIIVRSGAIIYAADSLNITNDIVDILNKRYKSGK